MLYKKATYDTVAESIPLNDIDSWTKQGLIRTASGKTMIEAGSDKSRILEAEIEKHPTALFFRSKAIKADEPNSNGDYFTKDELVKAHKTFEGVPFFTNHDNQNIENGQR